MSYLFLSNKLVKTLKSIVYVIKTIWLTLYLTPKLQKSEIQKSNQIYKLFFYNYSVMQAVIYL